MSSASCGTVTVESAFDPNDVSVECTMGSPEITPGETVDVSYQLQNNNDDPANMDVAVTVDGDVLDEQTVSVSGRSISNESVSVEFQDTGQFNVDVEITDVRRD